ncbi:MAG: hypothetical protein ACTSVU_01720 [Promethearchaeota archaeon]
MEPIMYYLQTKTSWQKTPIKLELHDMNDAITPYPLIESAFFEDMNTLCRKNNHYVVEMGLLHLVNQTQKELNPDLWILIWGKDFKDRIFQILIERPSDYGGRGAIAAIGPNDLLEFFSSMKRNAILPTLTLLSSPEKMKAVYIIVSRPKSYNEKAKEKQQLQGMARFKNWIDELKRMPNKEGQWFPSNAPKCPICGGPIVGIADEYRIGFGYMICPECGYMNRKPIGKKRDFE